MKILQLVYNLASGGAERFTVDLSNELIKIGNEVTLCALRDDKINNNGFFRNDLDPKIKYINLKVKEGFNLSNIYRFYKIIKSEQPDVVHAHLNLINYVFPLTYIFRKTNFIHTIHNNAQNEISNKLEYNIRRFFYKNKKVKAITISEETTNTFVNTYKIDCYKEIINGRSTPDSTPELKKVKDEILQPHYKTFIHVGRFHPFKNQQLLVETINKLNNNGHNVRMYIIGSGFDADEAKELREKAGDEIFFLGRRHNIADYYYAADAFCLSSIHEGLPITMIESFACGCTPICTPAGGIRNMIIDGETGYLSQSFDAEDYYSAFERYFSSDKPIKKETLKNLFLSKYHINACAKNYLNAYQEN